MLKAEEDCGNFEGIFMAVLKIAYYNTQDIILPNFLASRIKRPRRAF